MLRDGELDFVIIALPFVIPGVTTRVLYEEPFSVVVPEGHRWQDRKAVKPSELAGENLLVLTTAIASATRCWRPARPVEHRGAQGRAGSSLETIRNMVASGLGVSVLPASALTARYASRMLKPCRSRPPVPSRKVALAGARASIARWQWTRSPMRSGR